MTVYYDSLYHLRAKPKPLAFLPADFVSPFCWNHDMYLENTQAKATAVNDSGYEKLMKQSRDIPFHVSNYHKNTNYQEDPSDWVQRSRLEMKMMIRHIWDKMATVHRKFKNWLLGDNEEDELE